MVKLHIDSSDGCYTTRPLTDEEAAEYKAHGSAVAHLEDDFYAAYLDDCRRSAHWQALWQSIANEQSTRSREKELRPLEEADRTIVRLTDELERSKRMEAFYETHYLQQLDDKHRATHAEFTCVYPKPGCDVDLLSPEWREHAQELIDQYKPHGPTRQGCCCEHTHRKLDSETCHQLRNDGFIVERNLEEPF